MRRQIPVVLSKVSDIPLAEESPTVSDNRAQSSIRAPLEPVSPRAWRALSVASLATVLVGFNSTATNIALDDIQAGFIGATAADIGWGVAGFFIGTAAFLPLAGRLADRIGRKRIFQLGVAGLCVVGGLFGYGGDSYYSQPQSRAASFRWCSDSPCITCAGAPAVP